MKRINPDEESLLRRYLLGQVTEDEQQRVELEFLSDDGRYEQLLAMENELKYDYAQGLLTNEEIKLFKEKFLKTEHDQEKVDEARHIMTRLGSRGRAAERPRAFMTWLMPVAAAACIAILAVTAWILMREPQATTLPPVAKTPVQSPPPAAAPVVITLMLSPGLTRDAQGQARVMLPPDADFLRLELALPRGAAQPPYDGVLETAEGKEIWRGAVIAAAAGAPSVAIDIPADNLSAADYLLSLRTADGAGVTTEVADYSFRVLR